MPVSRSCLLVTLAAAGLLFVPPVHAAQPAGFVPGQADGIGVHDAWARASAGNATTGAAYLTLTGGAQPDQLVALSTPVAATAEVHQSFTDNGVMKMRAAPSVALPPGKAVAFAPGGYHVMLMGLKQPLTAGQSFPLTLTFARAAPVTVEVRVQALGRGAVMDDNKH
jgi:periplasmic copper chaperone A